MSIPSTAAAQVNVTTYHNDIGRTGQNLSETTLNLSNVNPNQFGKLFAQPVDGLIYAQPLYMSGITIAGTKHNVVYVATEHDSVYAFDADSNGGIDASPLWQISFLSAAHGAAAGATTVPSTIVSTDIYPEVGITGTPVIDPATNTLYIVGKTMENSVAIQRLHAIDITSGAEKFGGPVVITATVPGTGNGSVSGSLTFDSLWENQRPGLLLLNGIVYVGFAAHGDNGPWHGWVIGYNASTLSQTGAYCASPNGTGSGFWMSGAGLAADQIDPVNKPFGRMFIASGNGDYNATKPYSNSMDYGDSHIGLDLTNGVPTVEDEFTTNQQASLNSQDGDVGSGGLIVLPNQSGTNPHLAVQAGKGGTMYLINRDNMGGYNTTTDQVLQAQAYSVGSVGVWSTPAYFNGTVYYWGRFDNLKAFPLVNGLLSTTPTLSSEKYGYPGSTPSISANGTSQGIVWSIDSEAYANSTPGPAVLQAHQASNVATTLYSSSTNAGRDSAGVAVKFTVPTVANGKVYVGSATEVDVYGLLNGVTQTSAPVITPGTQSYSGTLSVTITDSTPGAAIYYSTDGSSASTSSTLYTGPIAVTGTETINAVAGATGLLVSAQTSATYTNISEANAVTFSLPTGTYGSAQTVSLSDTTANASIYYTTNGSPATTSSTLYTGPIPVNSTETISAVATAPGLSPGPVIAQTYTIQLGATGISFSQGFSTSAGQMVLNGYAQLNDSRLQLTDGNAGEAASAWYVNPVNIQAFTSDFTFQLSNPSANGYTFAIQNASQKTAALGGNASALGYAPIPNSIAIKFDLYNSAGEGTDSTGLYLNGATPTVPAIDLSSTGINLHSDDAIAAHITYDGTTLTMRLSDMVTSAVWSTSWTINIPSTIGSNTAYVGFTGSTGGLTASQKVLTWSFVSSAPAAAPAATPTFSVGAGTYTNAINVSISDTTANSTIYYTLDGSTPTTSSAVYSGAINVGKSETLNAIAVASGYSPSAVASAAYVINLPAAAAPTFSLAAGTYTSAQTVAISDSTGGASIYYTTNGVAPTASSNLYSGPIAINATETINAIAIASGYSNSSTATATYTISLPAAMPAISPAAGTYTGAQTITISDSTPGATIYYTTNGNAPSTSSTVYSGSFVASQTETVKAVAIASGSSISSVASAAYTINGATQTAAPTFNLPGGVYNSNQTITMADSTPGAVIYYTVEGGTPTTSSPIYKSPVTLVLSRTVQAIAVAPGMSASQVTTATYTLTVATPVVTPPGGGYTGTQTVTITTASPGAKIFYTTNGSIPSPNSTVYTGPLTVSASEHVNVVGIETGYTTSPVVYNNYIISAGTAQPTFSLPAGTYSSPQTVTINETTSGTTVYYTTSGGTPTSASPVYTGPITISSTETLRAIAVSSSLGTSGVTSASYTITPAPAAAAPTFSIAAGTYTTAQTVSLADGTPGASIYYTTNGTPPSASSSLYSGPINVGSSETIQAIATATGYSTSPVASASYAITPPAAAPAFSVSAGTYTGAQTLILTDSTPGASIYYTTNGTQPSSSSSLYGGPITISSSETVQAIATASGYSTSPVVSAAYTISSVTPVVNFPSAFTATGLNLIGATITSNKLQLTDGGAGEARTAWFTTPVNVQKFTTDFNFQQTAASADGFTFTIQGSNRTIYAQGGNGYALGYAGIPNSVAVKFDLYSNSGEGSDSTGFYINGASPTVPAVDMTSSAINLHSGDIMHAHITYDGTTLTLTITDTVTNRTFTTSTAINIPGTVGANVAYVGFTGGTGGLTAVQNVLNWTYSVN